MTPSSFTFKLSVPNDPKMAAIVGDMARHAADYANLDEAKAAAFYERALAAAATALNGDSSKTTLLVFSAADGTLKLTIGSQSITQPLPTS
jgi:hypothetical protein